VRAETCSSLYIIVTKIKCVFVGLQCNISPQYPLRIGCYKEYVEGSINTKFPDLQIDNHLNLENHAEPKMPNYTNHRMQLGSACSASATAHSQNSLFGLFTLYSEIWNYWEGAGGIHFLV
jgi:hypothetical protein